MRIWKGQHLVRKQKMGYQASERGRCLEYRMHATGDIPAKVTDTFEDCADVVNYMKNNICVGLGFSPSVSGCAG